ncbi:hypothetical protein RhiLY_02608 [Ceratobasidium sp. AG-Ba]|nr:hypothetical protein RhiLY_02608 [Ceratobasidium sp. AG-Ba]
MTDKTYSRPVKTTSKTNWERIAIKRINKQIKNGKTPDPLPEDSPPAEVPPQASQVTQSETPLVPTLAGQEDIPGLDEEQNLLGLDVAAMPGGGMTYYSLPKSAVHPEAQHEDQDNIGSNADTVIEEGNTSSSEDDEEAVHSHTAGPGNVLTKENTIVFRGHARPGQPFQPHHQTAPHPFGTSSSSQDKLIDNLLPEEFAFLAANFPQFEPEGFDATTYGLGEPQPIGGALDSQVNHGFAPPLDPVPYSNPQNQPNGSVTIPPTNALGIFLASTSYDTGPGTTSQPFIMGEAPLGSIDNIGGHGSAPFQDTDTFGASPDQIPASPSCFMDGRHVPLEPTRSPLLSCSVTPSSVIPPPIRNGQGREDVHTPTPSCFGVLSTSIFSSHGSPRVHTPRIVSAPLPAQSSNKESDNQCKQGFNVCYNSRPTTPIPPTPAMHGRRHSIQTTPIPQIGGIAANHVSNTPLAGNRPIFGSAALACSGLCRSSVPNSPLARLCSLLGPTDKLALRRSTPVSRLGSPLPAASRTPPYLTPPMRTRSISPRRSPVGSDTMAIFNEAGSVNPSHGFDFNDAEPEAIHTYNPSSTPLDSEELVDCSVGFPAQGSVSRLPSETPRAGPISGPWTIPNTRASAVRYHRVGPNSNYAAPTKAEYTQRQTKEARAIKAARKNTRKSTVDGADGKSNRPKELGAYPDEHQEVMFIMRASIQHDFLHRGPWIEGRSQQIARAKLFAQKFITLDVEEVVTDDFERTSNLHQLRKTDGQLRTAGQDEIKTMVALYYDLKEGDVEKIDWLQRDNRFLCPGGDTAPENLFDIELMSKVLAHFYFGTSRRIGYLFMDLVVNKDDPELLENLLSTVGVMSDNPANCPSVMDQSTEAKCGPSLATIAFAGINIYHALERLKVPKQRNIARSEEAKAKAKKRHGPKKPTKAPEFVEEKYAEHWNKYVCALAKHSRLGVLRASFLAELK